MKHLLKIEEVIELFAKKTGCKVQKGGCPCNTCFHDVDADFRHICWLIILGMRGFHGSVYSARMIMKGMFVYYNFITKHQGINCSPYELATDLKLNEGNKWLELISLAQNVQ